MAGDATSRKVIRDEIVSRFTTALTGGGNPYLTVLGHDRRDFEGESPVLLVLSKGIHRVQWGLGTDLFRTNFLFTLLSFVAEADTDAGRPSSDVEDEIDATEKALADAVIDNKLATGFWSYMHFDLETPSEIIPANVGGEDYKMEMFTLVVEVEDA